MKERKQKQVIIQAMQFSTRPRSVPGMKNGPELHSHAVTLSVKKLKRHNL